MASLEEQIDTLTKAVNRNSDLLEKSLAAGGGAAAATTGKAGAKTGAKAGDKAPAKSRYTAAQVQTAVGEVKDKIDATTAKAIITRFGGDGCNLAKLITMPETFDNVMEACAEAIAAAETTEEEEDDEI